MLSEVLSNQLCSLRPNEDKLTFSAIFELDNEAKIMNQWFGKTIIHSNHRFTYETAQTIIEQTMVRFIKNQQLQSIGKNTQRKKKKKWGYFF